MLGIHFLDVGRGDCTIIEFPSDSWIAESRIGIVDINLSEGHTNPIAYLNERIGRQDIFRFILTHPHRDHLFGLRDLAEATTISNFWDINHNFEPDKSAEQWEQYEPHWNQYLDFQKSDGPPRYLKHFKRENDRYQFLVEDRIRVLSPTSRLEELAMENTDDDQRVHEACFVLKISYADRHVILGGDADYTCWENIFRHYEDAKSFLKADVLKASHHGHESGYHEDALRLIDPDYVVISDASGTDADYSEVYQKKHGASVYTTWDEKNWVLHIHDDGKIEFKWNEKGRS